MKTRQSSKASRPRQSSKASQPRPDENLGHCKCEENCLSATVEAHILAWAALLPFPDAPEKLWIRGGGILLHGLQQDLSDVSMPETLAALLAGATIGIASQDAILCNMAHAHPALAVTHLFITPPWFLCSKAPHRSWLFGFWILWASLLQPSFSRSGERQFS